MNHRLFLVRKGRTTIAIIGAIILFLLVILVESKFQTIRRYFLSDETTRIIAPFPVSVDIKTKTIIENDYVKDFYTDSLANNLTNEKNWLNQLAALLATKNWYQNLASPVSRVVVIWPGERKEQIIENVQDILHWTEEDKLEFQRLMDSSYPHLPEGKYFPGQYITHRQATPQDVFETINQDFEDKILSRYTKEVEDAVPLEDAFIIASLLEREASDFENMREISGVIWNRLFINMPLQLDATLQYVKGDETSSWWPQIRPEDKYLDSLFNTYENKGLPPAPIANPSAEAILAALNPTITDCLYYFHSEDANYYCSKNYEDHVSKLRAIYGQ